MKKTLAILLLLFLLPSCQRSCQEPDPYLIGEAYLTGVIELTIEIQAAKGQHSDAYRLQKALSKAKLIKGNEQRYIAISKIE